MIESKMHPLKYFELGCQTLTEAVRGKVEVVELEDLTGKVPQMQEISKSMYVSSETHRNIYVLEQRDLFVPESYVTRVWQFDSDFTVEEAARFLKEYEKSNPQQLKVFICATAQEIPLLL